MPYVTCWEIIGIEKGMKIGWKDGIEEVQLETAQKMLNEGLSIPLISKCTLLTEEEIKVLIKSE